MTGEAEALTARRLAVTVLAHGKGVRHLGDPQARSPHDDLEQDLEAERPQRVGVHQLTAQQEETTHRIRESPERLRERCLRRRRRQVGDQRPRRWQGARVPLVQVAARDDEVRAIGARLLEQCRDDLGWVLQVPVDDADPLALRARRSPATTAPPSPPSRSPGGRCSSESLQAGSPSDLTSASTTAGVESSLSSTKRISQVMPCKARRSCSTSGATFADSFRVGTSTESSTVCDGLRFEWSRAARPTTPSESTDRVGIHAIFFASCREHRSEPPRCSASARKIMTAVRGVNEKVNAAPTFTQARNKLAARLHAECLGCRVARVSWRAKPAYQSSGYATAANVSRSITSLMLRAASSFHATRLAARASSHR